MTEPPPLVNWVVALRPEADFLIARLGMKPVSGTKGFSLYRSACGSHQLVLSGVGKANAAAAVGWLAGRTGSASPSAWLNFGIAGQGDAAPGTAFRAGRITDAATGRSWYPPVVWPRREDRFATAELLTIDMPSSSYPATGEMIDMEGAGFIAAARRFVGGELIQLVKVISDNRHEGFAGLDGKKVREMCAATGETLVTWSGQIAELVREERQRVAPAPGVESVLERYRFSATESHRFAAMARRAVVLGLFPSVDDWVEGAAGWTDGKTILSALESLLADAEGAEDGG